MGQPKRSTSPPHQRPHPLQTPPWLLLPPAPQQGEQKKSPVLIRKLAKQKYSEPTLVSPQRTALNHHSSKLRSCLRRWGKLLLTTSPVATVGLIMVSLTRSLHLSLSLSLPLSLSLSHLSLSLSLFDPLLFRYNGHILLYIHCQVSRTH